MLFPKKVKFRKSQRGRKNPKKKSIATRGSVLAFGSFGLKAEEPKWINSKQIEASRKTISRFIQKGGKMWIRIFPDKPITQKPPEVGMGKGKGDPVGYVAPVKSGTVIFEVDGIDEKNAREALRKAGSKLPLRTKIISRE
ncbi:50S ribosomal protein L16 [Patescibacteria group bacterium]|nr:50S ribosomal protein L16 [Patescibacteria group bacterium]